jgi:site-specific recombinase XerD
MSQPATFQPPPRVVPFPEADTAPRSSSSIRCGIAWARHYSPRTEDAYVHWIRRYIVFHNKRHPSEMGAADISRFLTWLAVERHISASTQNQALASLLFLYREVLHVEMGSIPPVVRARTPERLPSCSAGRRLPPF